MNNRFNKFVKEIVELYQKPRAEDKPDARVRRGRAPARSAEIESAFACVLSELLPKHLIYIDFPITIPRTGTRKKKTVYPDIMILKKGTSDGVNFDLFGIVELKADPGWLREDWAENRKRSLKEIEKAKTLVMSDKEQDKNWTVTVNAPLYSFVVIITDRNHPEHLKSIEENEMKHFVLMRGNHPGDTKFKGKADELVQDITHGQSDWDEMVTHIKKVYR